MFVFVSPIPFDDDTYGLDKLNSSIDELQLPQMLTGLSTTKDLECRRFPHSRLRINKCCNAKMFGRSCIVGKYDAEWLSNKRKYDFDKPRSENSLIVTAGQWAQVGREDLPVY